MFESEMPIYCLDTSAINHIHDELDRKFIVAGLVAASTFRLTAINIIEALGTKSSERRQSLLRLMATLTGDFRPLGVPNDLLVTTALAYQHRTPTPTISINDEQDGLWIALRDPSRVSDDMARDETLQWVKRLEMPVNESHSKGRSDFQRLFTNGVERPLSAAALIRHYAEQEDFVYEVVAPAYTRATNTTLAREKLRDFFAEIPHWPLWLAGWAYSIYSRAVQIENFSSKKNAGVLDLWCAIYLPHCDCFVTDDYQQYKALRTVNVFNPRRTRILPYKEFRKRLLVG